MALGFIHAARLGPGRDAWVIRSELIQRLLQISVAAEKRQIVAGLARKLIGYQLTDWAQAGAAMLITGGQVADHRDAQLLSLEGRLHVDPFCLFRQSEQVGVILCRAQGGGKQGCAVRGEKALLEKGRGYYVAQAQG